MADFIQFEIHQTFASASQRARGLAMQHKQQTGIRRTSTGWEVLVPPIITKTTVRGSTTNTTEYEAMEFNCDDDADEIRQQLVEELDGDREDWSRSEEEGWYYGDNDQSKDPDFHDQSYGRFQAPRDPYGRTLPTGSGW